MGTVRKLKMICEHLDAIDEIMESLPIKALPLSILCEDKFDINQMRQRYSTFRTNAAQWVKIEFRIRRMRPQKRRQFVEKAIGYKLYNRDEFEQFLTDSKLTSTFEIANIVASAGGFKDNSRLFGWNAQKKKMIISNDYTDYLEKPIEFYKKVAKSPELLKELHYSKKAIQEIITLSQEDD